MRYKLIWILLSVASIGLLAVLCVIWPSQLMQLSQSRTEELRPYVQRYLDVTRTVGGRRDPDVMAQVATGNHLRDLIRYRCSTCPRIQVATRNQIISMEVLEYSETSARVRVREESGWRDVDPNTGAVIGACHAQASTHIFILARENGVWKVSDIGEIDAADVNPVDDTPELRAEYCPAN